MSTNFDKSPTPRTRTQELINKMLAQRKEMLVLLWKVSGIEPLIPNRPAKDLLGEFCQILVDYIASAHFGLYQRIAEETERRQRVLKLAKDLYPRIEQTTQIALEFNDKYGRSHGDSDKLPQDLSHLGVALAVRIELEDRLIAALLSDTASLLQSFSG
jgi:regulator of sigma D